MFEFIKLRQEIKRLKKLHDELVDEKNILKEKINHPEAELVIRNIIGREIGWYDYNKLDYAGKQNYYQGAQSLLNNEVFNNEFEHFIADQIKFIGIESKNHDQTMHIRSAIVALEAFMDRVRAVNKPQIKEDISLEKSTEAI